MPSLLKLRVEKKLDMPGVVGGLSRFTCSPNRGTEVQSEGTGWLELGRERLQGSEKAGTLAAVSSLHGTLTCGSPSFTAQGCGEWSPVGGIWVTAGVGGAQN